jgi:hypothetical protein
MEAVCFSETLCPSVRPYGSIRQKITIRVFTAARTSKLKLAVISYIQKCLSLILRDECRRG